MFEYESNTPVLYDPPQLAGKCRPLRRRHMVHDTDRKGHIEPCIIKRQPITVIVSVVDPRTALTCGRNATEETSTPLTERTLPAKNG